ncbi:MAG TPA: 2-dehydropantoate 2-reductase [Anaerolineales bacterium]|nr:2-dehydropantoate 2-reductase [Anaerolineales bacterium]
MNITILGTGALACLFAAKLAPLADVTLLGSWKLGLEALQRQGIWVEEESAGQVKRSHVRLPVTQQTKLARGADVVLVLTKSYQTARSAQQAQETLTADGIAITLQNGLGNWEVLAQAVGEERAVWGVTTQGAAMLAPGVVRYAGGGNTWLGQGENPTPTLANKIAQVAELFTQAGFPALLTPHIAEQAWGKLLANAAINPITALLRIPNGEVLNRPQAHALLQAVVAETAQVAQAYGMRLPPNPLALVESIAASTATNRSSMLQDVENGRLTEIDAITGKIVALAEACGIAVPTNQVLFSLVTALQPAD